MHSRQGRLAKGVAANVYTVYLIHPPLVVGFAYAIHTVACHYSYGLADDNTIVLQGGIVVGA